MTEEVPELPMNDEDLGGGVGERRDGDGTTSTTEADDDKKSRQVVGAETQGDRSKSGGTLTAKVSKLIRKCAVV